MSDNLLGLLQSQLAAARQQNSDTLRQISQSPTIRIPGIGQAISGAYEQLRKAAEYAEEHLLLQRAIRRFYNRSLPLNNQQDGSIGEELVVELTQAGYLINNTVSVKTAANITKLCRKYVTAYQGLRQAHISSSHRLNWTLDVLSIETEALLNPRHHTLAIAWVAYQHYLQVFPRKKLAVTAEEDGQYELSLYIAVHRALLKSDIALVRYDLMRIYGQTTEDPQKFAAFNKVVDERYSAKLTLKLRRVVNHYGAPLRVLKDLADERPDLPELLNNRTTFLDAYDHQITKEYKNLEVRLNKGVVKSILFVFITKIVVGIGIEIPYDLLVHGSVATLPLAINLLFPPLYMASFKFGLRKPSLANAEALHAYIDQILYDGTPPPEYAIRMRTKPISGATQFVYSLLFFVPLALVVYVLALIGFNIVQGIIFFVFLCTVSILGFRLSRMVRELELVTKEPGFLAAAFDFFRLPFIVAGQWISGRYARLNLMAYVMDIVIELPLKTVLKLVRQWTRFLNEKHDEII